MARFHKERCRTLFGDAGVEGLPAEILNARIELTPEEVMHEPIRTEAERERCFSSSRAQLYFGHVLDAIEAIESFGMAFEDFRADPKTSRRSSGCSSRSARR
jgi:hypothetical protein